MTIYVLDTNVISDIAAPIPKSVVIDNLIRHRHDVLCLCEAVDYEIKRGYLKNNAARRLWTYETRIKTQFQWVKITDQDWQQAAEFWADAANKGRALSDVDLLVAAIAKRLNGIIVSADTDFDELPLRRENWRSMA